MLKLHTVSHRGTKPHISLKKHHLHSRNIRACARSAHRHGVCYSTGSQKPKKSGICTAGDTFALHRNHNAPGLALGFSSSGATVSKSDLTQVINQHVCISDGVVHLFKLQWAASEPRAHYLVAVEVLPEHDEPRTVHLMLRRSIPPNALLKLLDDAVETSSLENVAHGR